MTRIAIIAGSSASGASCIKNLLSIPELIVKGCFRTQERADTTQSSLPPYEAGAYESHVGIDANQIDTLKRALEGVDRALLVTPLDYSVGLQNDVANSINMIKAAKEVGVQRIVHVGSWTVNDPVQLPILSARFKPTEEYLETIGDEMEWTVLRGGYFMSNFSHVHLARIQQENRLLAVPDCNIPPVDVRDIGEAAAALLGGNFDNNYIYNRDHIECCGPALLSHVDIARQLSAGVGRTITYPNSPNLEEWCETVDNPIMLELYKYMAEKSSPGLPFEPTKFGEVLGRKPTSLRQWAQDHKDVFVA